MRPAIADLHSTVVLLKEQDILDLYPNLINLHSTVVLLKDQKVTI